MKSKINYTIVMAFATPIFWVELGYGRATFTKKKKSKLTITLKMQNALTSKQGL
jgi:hypothetical protein